MRLSQLVFVPLAFLAGNAVMPGPSDGVLATRVALVEFTLILCFVAILLAPNIAFHLGAAFSNFLDPMDWTPAEEEIALRPIQQLIDKDRYEDAFDELNGLLKTHKPTYEALHIQAKLLNHYRRFDDAVATLFRMIPLSKSPQQQLIAMELLETLANHRTYPTKPCGAGARLIRISHPLILFNPQSAERSVQKEITPGEYQVEPIQLGRDVWLVLKGETWGNAEVFWEAVGDESATEAAAKRGFLYNVAQMHRRVVYAIKGKPWREAKADSKSLHKEANQLMRQGEWAKALPLLEKAAADDPDCYEIAYRLVQATRQTGTPYQTRVTIDKVLGQSRWSENEARMLKELNR